MKPDPDRQALIDQMTQRFRKKLEEHYTDDNATLEQIEEAVEKIGQAILPELQQKLTNKRAKKPRDNQRACPCGGKARYRGQESKTLVTRHGCCGGNVLPTTVASAARDGLLWMPPWHWMGPTRVCWCANGWFCWLPSWDLSAHGRCCITCGG